MMKHLLFSFYLVLTILLPAKAQHTALPVKVDHAEPLCTDLIRDLGARKGERELNAGWVTQGNRNYTTQGGFVEYEFAPVNRLGLEVEVPFLYETHQAGPAGTGDAAPRERIESVNMAFQYTFLVSPKAQLSMAAGNIFELRLHSFNSIQHHSGLWKGQALNPFLIIAKRWGRHLHSMLYAGPEWYAVFGQQQQEINYQFNLSLHYMFRSPDFIGLELNQESANGAVQTLIGPQAKVKVAENMAVGLAASIPISQGKGNTRFLVRLIYSP